MEKAACRSRMPTDSCQKRHPDWPPCVRSRRWWDPETIRRRHRRELWKASRDPEGIGLREAGFDPVGDAGMLPDQRVGSHAQGPHLAFAGNLNVNHVRLARDPPAGVTVDLDFFHRRALPHPLGDKAWVEVATELGDKHS